MDLQKMANGIRGLAVDMVEAAGFGHPGMPLGAADIVTTLMTRVMNYDVSDPTWANRDRFVLSAGHGSAMLYAALHLAGYPITEEDVKNFRQLGYVTSGHPEVDQALGIECTTGPLGQGIGMAVGMAIAEQIANQKAPEVIDHYTYALAGDGCLMEGISHEACELAGRLKLNKLIVLFDDNDITIDGRAQMATSVDHIGRFKSYGWATLEADGHDFDAIEKVINEAKKQDKPVFVKLKTTIGKYSANADSPAAHGSVLGPEKAAATKKAIGLSETAFELPEEIRSMWKDAAAARAWAMKDWTAKVDAAGASADEVLGRVNYSEAIASAIDNYKKNRASDTPTATRMASGEVLAELVPVCPQLVGGSADLSTPNQTKTPASKSLNDGVEGANYVNYGVREHGMGAIMNGIALHGPYVPYGGTFFVFADYMKPAIRLSAIMNQQVVYVMTHDTFAIGEDGPTHQPIEHFSSYRSLPNMVVFRPADRVEVAESWQAALERKGPSIIALTRLPVGETGQSYRKENLVSQGGYIVRSSDAEPELTLISSGDDLAPTLGAAEKLAADGITCEVVSMPSLDLFVEQNDAYKSQTVRGKNVFVVEAASTPGWDKIVSDGIAFKSMNTFGESGKTAHLLEHFGYTADGITEAAKSFIEKRRSAK